MTIRIKCPHCQKLLGVKDHLAGKKVACPVCKKGLKIPAPVSAAADVEDLAAAAFADAPKPAEKPKEEKPIAFTCPFCDAEVSVAYELGGKQTPCPECKRIIKVPKPIADKPKDWRTVDRQGPSFARQPEIQAPDGAWAPATARRVSQQALEEAGAMPEVPAEPIGVRGWIRRGVYAAGALIVLLLVWMFLPNFKGENQSLTRALAFIEPTTKLTPEATAAIHRAAGEYYARKEKPDVKKALEHFGKARAMLDQLPADGPRAIDRDTLLWEIAKSWIDLVGSDMGEGKKYDWKGVQPELRRTLQNVSSPEARALALRDLTGRLLAMGPEGEQAATGLAVQVEGAPGKDGKPQAVQQVVLLLRDGKKDQANEVLPPPKGDEITDLAPRLAYSQGLARENNYDEARALADKPGPPLHRLEALLGVAAVALADKNAADRARPLLEKAFELASIEAKQGKKIPVWDLIDLGCLAARAGMADRVPQVLQMLTESAAKGRVQLEQVLAQIERTPAFMDPAGVPLPEKDSLAHGLALEALARHNARVDSRSRAAVLDSVDGLDEKVRPFVLIGEALGEEDATRR